MPKKYHYTRKTGRPTKTSNDLPSNWKAMVIELSLQGKFEEQIRTAICLSAGKHPESIDTLWSKLKEREDEFQEVLKKATTFRKAWWLDAGQKGIKTTFFNTGAWFIVMKNCFGWRDKTEIEHGLSDSTVEKFANLPVAELLKRANDLIIGKSAGKPQ